MKNILYVALFIFAAMGGWAVFRMVKMAYSVLSLLCTLGIVVLVGSAVLSIASDDQN